MERLAKRTVLIIKNESGLSAALDRACRDSGCALRCAYFCFGMHFQQSDFKCSGQLHLLLRMPAMPSRNYFRFNYLGLLYFSDRLPHLSWISHWRLHLVSARIRSGRDNLQSLQQHHTVLRKLFFDSQLQYLHQWKLLSEWGNM